MTLRELEELEQILENDEFVTWEKVHTWAWDGAPKRLAQFCRKMFDAIKYHQEQQGDDRCWLDDLKLYEAAGLPEGDNRVGDKGEMLKNCARFIQNRCEDGEWKTYAQLENELATAKKRIKELEHQLERAYEELAGEDL